MAEIIGGEQSEWRRWALILGIGIGAGVLFAIITWLLSKYVVGPLVCEAEQPCAQSISSGANIATLLVAITGVAVGIRFHIARPLLVAVGVAAVLWGLGDWLIGLHWAESFGWIVLLYAVAYVLFVWMNRYAYLPIVIGAIVLIVIIERILLALL